MVIYGSQKRTRVSFNINALVVENSNKIVTEKHFQNGNATPSAKDVAQKTLDKGADLHGLYRPNMATIATSFFWDRASNSVQPMAELAVSA